MTTWRDFVRTGLYTVRDEQGEQTQELLPDHRMEEILDQIMLKIENSVYRMVEKE